MIILIQNKKIKSKNSLKATQNLKKSWTGIKAVHLLGRTSSKFLMMLTVQNQPSKKQLKKIKGYYLKREMTARLFMRMISSYLYYPYYTKLAFGWTPLTAEELGLNGA